MSFSELSSKGLRRELKAVIPYEDFMEKANERLRVVGKNAKVAGFRPGKIPLDVLRQRYGASVTPEVLEQMINGANRGFIEDKGWRIAMPPRVEDLKFDDEADIEYRVVVELMPDVPEVDLTAITLDRPAFEVGADDVEEGLVRIAEQNKKQVPLAKPRACKEGDVAVIDFKGSIDGEFFEGGEGTDFALHLGSGMFIPGFEEQVTGMKVGEEKVVKLSFPDDYHAPSLAGKETEFAVTVKEIRELELPEINDEFAANLGMQDLEKMRENIKSQLADDFTNVVRQQLKKQLFDQLDDVCEFDIPPGMLEIEFDTIWKQVEAAKNQGDEELKSKSDDELREEYMEVARRRVRLGLFLAEVGNKNQIQVSQDDVRKAVLDQMRRFPGQEKAVIDHYQKPENLEELKGPIIEDKAVDFILSKVSYNDMPVGVAELREAYNAGINWVEEQRNKVSDKKSSADKKKTADKKSAAKKKGE